MICQLTRREGMRLHRGIVEIPVGTLRSRELLINETTESWTNHAVVRRSLRHTTHNKIDVVGMGIGCTQFFHHLIIDR